MEVKVIDKQVESCDGIHRLAGKVYIPECTIRGIFHVVHGMIEHIERYDAFMKTIASHGFVCFGFDNLGHGFTAKDDSELGFFAHKDGYRLLCDDVNNFGCIMKKEYGEDLPYILMGHSMGSFIVRCTAVYYPNLCDKLIIMGTGGAVSGAKAGLALLGVLKKIKGEKAISPFAEKLVIGNYNKRFPKSDGQAWLSTVEEVRTAYRNDKYCSFHFSISAFIDLGKLNINCNSLKFFNGKKKELPILLVSGSDDPVGNYGKGVKQVYDKLKATGHNKVTFKLYKGCRHEILNDICRKKVINEILKFSV
ncbi:MAG TPA: alpha/beta hydrolase [Ruminococcaceae bacterium]|nr:alpha/beta hydrolase [Oscillospiraceae bacterium]